MDDQTVNSNGPTIVRQNEAVKERRRPLTKGIRTELRTLLENAVLDADSSLLSSVFSPCQSDDNHGALVAPLSAVLCHLQQIGHNVTRFNALSSFALKSIANRTRLFTIENKQGELLVRVNSHVRLHNDEKTVFVDNLPPFCTAERLEKRSSFFGRVVCVRMPRIGRIQRRIAQMIGGLWPAHSGFAFVQFVSKTAARRFCKRYATNSRLKRIHHHGQKHGRKRTATMTTHQQKSGETADVRMRDNGETVMECDDQSGKGIEPQNAFPPLLPGTVLKHSNSFSNGPNVGVRFRCNSVAEESVISESGNETDTQIGKMRENEKGSTEGIWKEKKDGTEEMRRKRRRRRPAGHRPPVAHPQSLNALFRHIQVFPLKQYRELRADYLRIKKARMGTLKKQLTGMAKKSEGKQLKAVSKERKENAARETEKNREKKGDGEKGAKRRRRRGKRGVGKLLGKAERAKGQQRQKDGENAYGKRSELAH